MLVANFARWKTVVILPFLHTVKGSLMRSIHIVHSKTSAAMFVHMD